MILGGRDTFLMVQSGGKHLSLVVEACYLQDFSHQQYETQYSKLLRFEKRRCSYLWFKTLLFNPSTKPSRRANVKIVYQLSMMVFQAVVETTHLKSMRKSTWTISPRDRGKNKKSLRPPPRNRCLLSRAIYHWEVRKTQLCGSTDLWVKARAKSHI